MNRLYSSILLIGFLILPINPRADPVLVPRAKDPVVATPAPTQAPALSRLPEFVNPGPKVVFTSDRDGGSHLYVMDLTGANVHPLLRSTAGFESNPDWSPAGDAIVFTAIAADRSSSTIHIVSAGGENDREIIRSTAALNGWPRFSPNGSRIAFVSNRGGRFQVFTARADGSDQRRLTNSDMEEARPSWSPDGQKIVFSGRADGVFQLFEVQAEGTLLEELTSGPLQKRSAEYSPDGRTILFHGTEGQIDTGPTQVYTMDVGTGVITQLTEVDGQAGDARWTHDGRQIAFTVRDRQGKSDIYVMNADGSGLKDLTPDPANDDQAAVSAGVYESIDISNSPDTKNIVPPPPGDAGE
jgi:Tol biopolymer transport system component